MKTPKNGPQSASLNFDPQIVDVLTETIGRPISAGQLWILPLDRQCRLLPVVIPIDSIPPRPLTSMLHNLMVVLRDTLSTIDAHSVIYALERTGLPGPTDDDRLWAAAIRRQASVSGLGVRGVFLCSPGGIRSLERPAERAASGS